MKYSGFFILTALCLAPLSFFANGSSSSQIVLFNFDRDSSQSPSKLKIEQISVVDQASVLPEAIMQKVGLTQGRVYILTSPTQPTGGYQYSHTQSGNKVSFCLNKPKMGATVTQAFSNPAAVAVVEDNSLLVSKKIRYCDM